MKKVLFYCVSFTLFQHVLSGAYVNHGADWLAYCAACGCFVFIWSECQQSAPPVFLVLILNHSRRMVWCLGKALLTMRSDWQIWYDPYDRLIGTLHEYRILVSYYWCIRIIVLFYFILLYFIYFILFFISSQSSILIASACVVCNNNNSNSNSIFPDMLICMSCRVQNLLVLGWGGCFEMCRIF